MSFLDNFRSAQCQSDFSIEVSDREWENQWKSVISKQTTAVKINFAKREVTLLVRQLKAGIVQDVIFHILSKKDRNQIIDGMTIRPAKGAKSSYEYLFKDGRLVDHECQFEYASKGDLIHTLVFEFQEVTLKSPSSEYRPTMTIGTRVEEKEPDTKQVLMEEETSETR